MSETTSNRRMGAGIVLGIGLGAFLDGIVLHQILQWHNMGSAVIPPLSMEMMRLNTRWDGWFHLVSWACTMAGVWMLWDAGRANRVPTARIMTGGLLFGWAVFNLVEGAVNHHLLGLHHVRDLPVHVPVYDWVFLGGSAALLVVGWRVMHGTAALLETDRA